MPKIKLNVLFKKIQKDDKKEVLEFHILGDEIPHKEQLISMAGGLAVLQIVDIEISAEFKSIQRDSKKVTLKFEAKGDSEDKIIKLYPKAGTNVDLYLEPSQMSFEDLETNNHEGIQYGVNDDGTVEVPENQMSMDIPGGPDPFDEQEELPFDDEDNLH